MIWLVGVALAGSASLGAVGPARDGHQTVQLRLDAPLAAEVLADPSALRPVAGLGRAEVTRVVAAEHGATVLAFDQSQSFARHQAAAVAAARALGGALPAGPVGVAAFGTSFVHVDQTDAAGLTAALGRLPEAHEGATRLKSGITDAIRWAAELGAKDGDLRQVVVFTDVGEESAEYAIDEVITAAREAGVRVHVVAFAGGGKGLAARLDEAQRLAEETGGRMVQVKKGVDPKLAAAVSPDGVLLAELAWCGVPAGAGYTEDRLSLEVWRSGERVATTPTAPFSQQVTGASTQPCAGEPASPAPADPGRPAVPKDARPTADAGPGGQLGWIFVIGALGALLFLLAFVAVLAVAFRQAVAPDDEAPPPPPRPVEPPPPPAPPPPPEPYTDPTTAADLPEARLLVERGPPALPPALRVAKREVLVGADPAADLRVDLPEISGRHARFELFKNGALWVTDLGSTNGTSVNGRRLAANERVALRPGDRIELASRVELRVDQPGRGLQQGGGSGRKVAGTIVEPLR